MPEKTVSQLSLEDYATGIMSTIRSDHSYSILACVISITNCVYVSRLSQERRDTEKFQLIIINERLILLIDNATLCQSCMASVNTFFIIWSLLLQFLVVFRTFA